MPEEVSPSESSAGEVPAGGFGPEGEISNDERTMAMLSWALSGLTFLVPLIIYLLKKDEGRFVKFHALQALYFSLVAVGVSIITCFFFWPVGIGLGIMWGMKANRGEWFEIPVVGGWVQRDS